MRMRAEDWGDIKSAFLFKDKAVPGKGTSRVSIKPLLRKTY